MNVFARLRDAEVQPVHLREGRCVGHILSRLMVFHAHHGTPEDAAYYANTLIYLIDPEGSQLEAGLNA